MAAYTKLFHSILHSTIWQEPAPTKIVWITMLAMADKSGAVMASVPGLARAAGVTLAECEEALDCLLAPDPYSRTKDYEGRRIEEIDGGWALLNHAKYRRLMSAEERREYNAAKQRERRERLKREAAEAEQTAEPDPSPGVNDPSLTVNDNQQNQHIQMQSTDSTLSLSLAGGPGTVPGAGGRLPDVEQAIAFAQRQWPDVDADVVREWWAVRERDDWRKASGAGILANRRVHDLTAWVLGRRQAAPRSGGGGGGGRAKSDSVWSLQQRIDAAESELRKLRKRQTFDDAEQAAQHRSRLENLEAKIQSWRDQIKS